VDELEVLADVRTPASQIVVHPHRDHQEVLVRVHVHPGERVEVRITEYYVALRSP
jgi:hypothetical protein